MSTTYAILHTPAGAGGIAVVLLAGPAAGEILERVFHPRRRAEAAQVHDHLCLGEIHDGQRRIDEAIVSFPAAQEGRSQLAEISVHGGPRIVQRVLELLAEAGAVVAEQPSDARIARQEEAIWPLSAPGMGNPAIGREMLATLSGARTHQALTMLTRQWTAGLSRLACQALADPDRVHLAEDLRRAAGRLHAMHRLLHPAEIVLAGPPNAGKSSLANALLGRPACIVTEVAGTTRDWVRELADLAGLAVWLTDTAGLWAPPGALDAEAVERAWRQIDRADLVLAVFAVDQPPPAEDEHWRRLLQRPNVIRVANKVDQGRSLAGCVNVSALTGEELPRLSLIVHEALGLTDLPPNAPTAFTHRQADLLTCAADAIDAGRMEAMRQCLDALLRGKT